MNHNADTTRLIVITVVQADTLRQIQSLRESLCRKFNAPWALRYPPHVTLRTGLIVPNGKLPEVFSAFTGLLAETSAFTIRTMPAACSTMVYEGEAHFFLYLPVEESGELVSLNRHLLRYCDYRKSDKTIFHPHVTLFWGDLPEADEQNLKDRVAQQCDGFGQTHAWRCNTVSLYKEEPHGWVEVNTIAFPTRDQHGSP